MDKSHKWQKQRLRKRSANWCRFAWHPRSKRGARASAAFTKWRATDWPSSPLGGEQGGHFCPGKPAAAPSRSGLNSYTAQTTFELIGERFMHDSLKADMASLTMKGVKWSKVEGARWGFDY